jgi:hypothetical protein
MAGSAALADAAILFGEPGDDAKIDREPFGFGHTLSDLDLFTRPALKHLTELYGGNHMDYFVAGAAEQPGSQFYSGPFNRQRPEQAIERLNDEPVRILMKRPENYHPLYRELLDRLFEQIVRRMGGLGGAQVERLEGGVFLTSAESITPFHFDPELNFFFQIAGTKHYHVFSPSVLQEPELESFYRRGAVDIGQVDLAVRDTKREHVFDLVAGRGLHQPHHAPHWVRTGREISISYSLVFETSATRARGRVRAFNHYLRRIGMSPTGPDHGAHVDRMKAGAITGLRQLKSGLRGIRRRIS